jgi:hypothetical protein
MTDLVRRDPDPQTDPSWTSNVINGETPEKTT